MKKKYIYNVIVFFFLITTNLLLNASNLSHKNNRPDVASRRVVSAAQRQNLQALSNRLKETFNERRAAALEIAQQRNLPLTGKTADGSYYALQYLDDDGRLVYYQTRNLTAAQLSSVDKLWAGGALGLNLSGSTIIIGMWDGGEVRSTHLEFGNPTRIVWKDDPSDLNSHATHVAGTIMAEGVDEWAKGMSYEAILHAWDFYGDIGKISAAASNDMLLSNHSYGLLTGWEQGDWSGNFGWHWFGDTSVSYEQDYRFGNYSTNTRAMDQITYNAPYYTIVWAAGNDRGKGPSSADISDGWWIRNPNWEKVNFDTVPEKAGGNDGFNCISQQGLAKNIITVGAVDGNGNMTSFSSWGPADDGRIKPDLVAKGQTLKSPDINNDNHYTTKQGTSMAAPVVTGTIGLLMEHYANTHQDALMKSSTVKALLLNTVYETNNSPAPDYMYGWGLLNAEGAANLITQNANSGGYYILENTLNNNQEHTFTYYSYGDEPIRVMICWTDTIPTQLVDSKYWQENQKHKRLNAREIMLVNDLDLRLIHESFTEYKPWILDVENPGDPANTGDNVVDNVEQVYIANPVAGEYTITVSHKGTLAGGLQNYSMVISGLYYERPEGQKIMSAYNIIEINGENNFIEATETVGFCTTPTNWGENENRLDTMYVTYSADTLYIGLTGALGNGNNYVVVYIDRDFGHTKTGVSNMSELTSVQDEITNAITKNLDLSDIPGFGAELAFAWNGENQNGAVRRFEKPEKYDNFDWILNAEISGDSNFVEVAIPFSEIYNNISLQGNQIALIAMLGNNNGSDLSNQFIPYDAVSRRELVIIDIDSYNDGIPDNHVLSGDTYLVSGNIVISEPVGDTTDILVSFYTYPGNMLVDTSSVNLNGDFSLNVIADMSGYIRAGGGFYLYNNFDTFTVNDNIVLSESLVLTTPGDLSDDNKINIFDASRAKTAHPEVMNYIRQYFGKVGKSIGEW